MTSAWNMQETRTIIRSRVSAEHFEFARRSLASAIDRREYARLHYHEIKDRWKSLLSVAGTPTGVWDIVLGGTSDSDLENEHETSLHAIGAHTIACVQSLHAIPDIFAHGIYYSLGYGETAGLSERDITAQSVQRVLSKTDAHAKLAAMLKQLFAAGEFAYLGALANHSKHRSIIKNSLTADMSATDSEPIRLNFEAFRYSGKEHEPREVVPLLEAEFDRMSKVVVDTGIELNKVLRLSTTET